MPTTRTFWLRWIASKTLSATYNIVAANLSLGDGKSYSSTTDCMARSGNGDLYKKAFDNLRSVGVAPVVATGNDGFHRGTNSPACVPGAVSVGATNSADTLTSFSNVSSSTSLLAPGAAVDAFNGSEDNFGTSFAAPIVAGAMAVLAGGDQNITTVARRTSLLRLTGTATKIGSETYTIPRLHVARAFIRDVVQVKNDRPDVALRKNGSSGWIYGTGALKNFGGGAH